MRGVSRVTALAFLTLLVIAGTALAAANGGLGKADLAKGMSGQDVKTLQTDLSLVGYLVKPSGVFGNITRQKVEAFQSHYKLTSDGVVGPKTKKKLLAVLKVKQGDSSTSASAGGSGGAGGPGSGSGSGGGTKTGTGDPGGVGIGPAPKTKVKKASLIDGIAIPAPGTPVEIEDILKAGNRIAFLPYIYGGGHSYYTVKDGLAELDGKAKMTDLNGEKIGEVTRSIRRGYSGYDCSGSVSFALFADGHKLGSKRLLNVPLDSSQYERYGKSGKGKWITIYANGGHAYMIVAGLRFDTVAQAMTAHGNGLWRYGDRWSKNLTEFEDASAFVVRHPSGW